MKQSIVQRQLDEVLGGLETVEGRKTQVRQPTYHPTSWLMINRILDVVDELTGGLAGWVQRFFSFAFIGGFAACVNLIAFYVFDHFVHLSVNGVVHNAMAFIVANEISLLTNFISNDFFTFRRMAGNRSWSLRCARFHFTACSGIILTYLLQFCLDFFLLLPSIFSLSIAIFLVHFYNFTFHHIFTYRHKNPAVSLGSEAELIKQTMIEEMDFDVDSLEIAHFEATSSR